jgi:hypothetical protein
MGFIDDVVAALDAALGTNTYFVEHSQSDGQALGNSMVTIMSGPLRVRFVRERGQVFAEATSVGSDMKWHDVRILADHIAGACAGKYESSQSLDQNVELVARFRDRFTEILGAGYSAAKRDLFERHRIALGGHLAEWLKEHPPD